MSPNELSSLYLPILEQVIDRHSLTVSPKTPLMDVLVAMGSVSGSSCLLPVADLPKDSSSMSEKKINYVLVKEADRLVGIFTEWDLVRLIASETNLQKTLIAEVMTRELVTLTESKARDLLTVMSYFRKHNIRHLPILDDRDRLVGVITPERLNQALKPINFLQWRQVEEVMTSPVIYSSPTASVLSVAKLMTKHHISCVVIAQADSEGDIMPLGIITERDILQFQTLDLNLAQTQAQTVMSTPLFSLMPTDSLWFAHQEMQEKHIRRIVVLGDRGEIQGIVTHTDLLQVLEPLEMLSIIAVQQQMIEEKTATLTTVNKQLKQEIDRRQKTEQVLQESEQRYRYLYENTPVMLHSIDRNGLLVSVSNYWLEKLGYERSEVIGQKSTKFLTEESRRYAEEVVLPEYFKTSVCNHVAYQMVKKNGEIIDVLLSAIAERDESGEMIRSLAILIDVTERNRVEQELSQYRNHLEELVKKRTNQLIAINEKLQQEINERKLAEEAVRRSEARLRHDALHDPLTGLPNRALLLDRLEQAIKHSQRKKDLQFAVLFLDLNRFKVINDSLGHLVGDQLLIALAHRLKECLRASDTLARLGGDEFVILLEQIGDVEEAITVVERIHDRLKPPFLIDSHEIFVSTSIGIALSSTRYNQPAQILRDADTAMYYAKARGESCHQVFNPSMHETAMQRLHLENDLRRALQRQEFVIHYQPIICLQTRQLQGVEALVRWQHPEQGLIFPTDFIPMAEETGLIYTLDQWILEKSCEQLRLWHEQFPAFSALTMSVNLSGSQFSQPNLISQVDRVLAETGLEGRYLKLEITENVLINNHEIAILICQQLREREIQICLDDFGTGYSSLSYLPRFPLNTLKIDRSFVQDIGIKSSTSAIIRTIATLANELGLELIAEGIETVEQMSLLESWGYHYGQGYWFSHSIDSQDMMTWLISN
ncbi:MAG: EAL domain-containing protein [Xenococcaceae cyanobacterium MO_188.B32]|nr:EAL domain-containing protein [Xenococcaceae cyanobacterium MO_188.B32]